MRVRQKGMERSKRAKGKSPQMGKTRFLMSSSVQCCLLLVLLDPGFLWLRPLVAGVMPWVLLWGVIGQTQSSWALKARLVSVLNQVFVWCVDYYGLRGDPQHKAATVLVKRFNDKISLRIECGMLSFHTPAHHVCTLTATSPLMVAELDEGLSPTLETVSNVLYSRMAMGVKEQLVSSRAQPGSPIKGSQAAAVPHLPVLNVKAASSEAVSRLPLNSQRGPSEVIRLGAGQLSCFDE